MLLTIDLVPKLCAPYDLHVVCIRLTVTIDWWRSLDPAVILENIIIIMLQRRLLADHKFHRRCRWQWVGWRLSCLSLLCCCAVIEQWLSSAETSVLCFVVVDCSPSEKKRKSSPSGWVIFHYRRVYEKCIPNASGNNNQNLYTSHETHNDKRTTNNNSSLEAIVTRWRTHRQ